jgi:hypothetical protein
MNLSGRNLPCPSSLSALKDAVLQEVMSIGLWRVPLTQVSPIGSKITLNFMFGNTYTILISKFDLEKCFTALISYQFQKMDLFQLQRIGK